MAFHGGLIGALIGVLIFSRRYGAPALTVLDLCSLVAPIGIFLGRIANFIRPELWGRRTDVPWAVIFPGTDGQPRHPSQIYEALLEGLLAFVILYALAQMGALRRPGVIAGVFAVVYGAARIFSEFFREPDPRLEDLGRGLTMGMVLSLPLIVGGLGSARVEPPSAGNLEHDRAPRRNQGEDRGAWSDHGRAVHAAGARPSRSRLLHEPRSIRRDGRFHHRARDFADVRRTDRALGGRSVVEHGLARSRPPGRAGAGARDVDQRCAARRPHRAGFSQCARRAAHRDQPGAGDDAARAARRLRRGGLLGPDASRRFRTGPRS